MLVTGDVEALALFKTMHICPIKDDPDGGLFFDFETLIPMPAILRGIQASSAVDQAIEAITGKTMAEVTAEKSDDPHSTYAARLSKTFRTAWTPEQHAAYAHRLANMTVAELEKGRQALAAIEETGYPTWYEWSIANWSTKWNSYHFSLVQDSVGVFCCRYDTAWSAPENVWNVMARMHPTLHFEMDSFDEGWNFALHAEASGGEMDCLDTVPCDDESYEKAYGYPRELEEEAVEPPAIVGVEVTVEVPDPLGAPPDEPTVKPNRQIDLDEGHE